MYVILSAAKNLDPYQGRRRFFPAQILRCAQNDIATQSTSSVRVNVSLISCAFDFLGVLR